MDNHIKILKTMMKTFTKIIPNRLISKRQTCLSRSRFCHFTHNWIPKSSIRFSRLLKRAIDWLSFRPTWQRQVWPYPISDMLWILANQRRKSMTRNYRSADSRSRGFRRRRRSKGQVDLDERPLAIAIDLFQLLSSPSCKTLANLRSWEHLWSRRCCSWSPLELKTL